MLTEAVQLPGLFSERAKVLRFIRIFRAGPRIDALRTRAIGAYRGKASFKLEAPSGIKVATRFSEREVSVRRPQLITHGFKKAVLDTPNS